MKPLQPKAHLVAQRVGNRAVAKTSMRLATSPLSIKDVPDDEASLTAKLDRFPRWHAVRATFQVLTFFVLL